MKVVWTEVAVGHLQAIHEYMAQTSPAYAQRVVDKLTRRSQQISAFPFSGRVVPEYELDDVRQIIESAYRIIYLIKDEQIEILSVLHTSRDELKPLG